MQQDKLLSNTITFLRFPLIIGVMFIHNKISALVIHGQTISSENMLILRTVEELFGSILPSISVPLFFFISGFLFVHKSDFTANTYFTKISRRSKTLLLPYLFWNLVFLSLTFVAQIYLNDFTSGERKNIGEYNWQELIMSFWASNKTGEPIAHQFWFIRDLMVTMVLSPIIFIAIKFLKKYSLLIFGLLWFMDIDSPVAGLSFIAIFFFAFGAYFGVNRINFITQFQKIFIPSIFFYVILVFLDLLIKKDPFNSYIHKFEILTGLIFAFNLSSYYINKGSIKVSAFLAGSSFFIFATHEPLLTFCRKMLINVLHLSSECSLIILYFVLPALIVSILLMIYFLLKRYIPRFTNMVTGGR